MEKMENCTVNGIRSIGSDSFIGSQVGRESTVKISRKREDQNCTDLVVRSEFYYCFLFVAHFKYGPIVFMIDGLSLLRRREKRNENLKLVETRLICGNI